MQSILPDGIADGLWSNDLERNLYQEEEMEQAQLPGRIKGQDHIGTE